MDSAGESQRPRMTKTSAPRKGRRKNMPAPHASLHGRIVFGTKNRHPFIAEAWRGRLHEYLGGLIQAADAFPDIIGGTADQVHLLVGIAAQACPCKPGSGYQTNLGALDPRNHGCEKFRVADGVWGVHRECFQLRRRAGIHCQSNGASPD
jgi:hypothetical protein